MFVLAHTVFASDSEDYLLMDTLGIVRCMGRHQLLQLSPTLERSIHISYNSAELKETNSFIFQRRDMDSDKDSPTSSVEGSMATVTDDYVRFVTSGKLNMNENASLNLESHVPTCWLNVSLRPSDQQVAMTWKHQTCRPGHYVSVHEAFDVHEVYGLYECWYELGKQWRFSSSSTVHSDNSLMWTGTFSCFRMGF